MIEDLQFLISDEEFSKELKQRFIAGFITAEQAFNYQCNYIDIMHKTLELGMFVTCVDSVPLEKPKYPFNVAECRVHKEAEKKVLFKGFEHAVIHTNNHNTQITRGLKQFIIEDNKVIDLLSIFKSNIELTEACKQLITK